MKQVIFLLAVICLTACRQGTKNTAAAPEAETTAGPYFVFSKRPMIMELRDPDNWCAARFAENAVVNADPKNTNLRYFAIDGQPHKIVFDYGHYTAAFALQRNGNQVEVITSDNYPACFSNRANFTLLPDNKRLLYDNKKDIHFEVGLQDLPNGLQVNILLPADLTYGMLVNRCETCK
ncbi:MAG: hypothetical protein SFV22_05380 [Saprospiraceae bacterium]|nr:hypothetical protein [Saprospiraceae bacterium]